MLFIKKKKTNKQQHNKNHQLSGIAIMNKQVLFPVLFGVLKVWMEKPTTTCKPFFPSIKVDSTEMCFLVFCSAFCVTLEYRLNKTWYCCMYNKVSIDLSSQEPCLP